MIAKTVELYEALKYIPKFLKVFSDVPTENRIVFLILFQFLIEINKTDRMTVTLLTVLTV